MYWIVVIPTERVEGSGYYDHNLGSRPMIAIFKNQYWGKDPTEDYVIDYGLVIPNLRNKPLLA